jgi:NTE family protein
MGFMDQAASGKTLGLALGGGGELGLAHLGVLCVLEEHGIRASFISGCSAGALVAAFYAAGTPVKFMRQIGLRLDWRAFQKFTLPVMALSTNEPLGRFLERFLPVRDFASLRIPIRIIATDLLTAAMVVFQGGPPFQPRGLIEDPEVVFEAGDFIEAIRASCARPIINLPVKMGPRLLVDGALTNNVPALLTRDMGADVVVAVDLHRRQWKQKPPTNIIAYAVQAQAIHLHWSIKHRKIAADVVIRPDFSDLRALDFSAAEDLVRCGEEAAREALPTIRKVLAGAES